MLVFARFPLQPEMVCRKTISLDCHRYAQLVSRMEIIVETVYDLALLTLVTFSLVQLSLLFIYVASQRNKRLLPTASIPWSALPRLTIQLPVFNELYVVEQLLDSIVDLQYPLDKLDIQILDDSTDETTIRIARKVVGYQQEGIPIQHIRRSDRTGFKAGALAYGLGLAKGDYIAIFDADFRPDPDFLLRALPSFTHDRVGVVQTRWLHLNEDYSLLTVIQAMALNAHFMIEQNARFAAGFFLNFNGTAGIWRKAAIYDAGGWQSDTLTEDLDLSYRAQLKGWQIVYREDIGVPAELPVTMNAIKSQQYRWMKGPAECARKLLGSVLTTPGASVGKKIQACFHLLNSSLFVLTLTMALVSVPMLYNGGWYMNGSMAAWQSNLFLVISLVPVLFWGIPFYKNELSRTRTSSNESVNKRILRWMRFVWLYPIFLAVMLGLSLHNSIAVVEGYLGIKTPFVRTPKFNLAIPTDSWTANVYTKPTFSWLVFLEIGLAFYFGAGILLGLRRHDYSMLSFHSLLTIGFTLVAGYSLLHAWVTSSAAVEPIIAPKVEQQGAGISE